MFRLRLIALDNPARQIDSRMVGADPLVIGRDAAADWTVEDPDRQLSRRHLSVRADGERLRVTDMSANGSFIGDDPEPVGRGREALAAPGQCIRIGPFGLVVEALPDVVAARDAGGAPQRGAPQPLFAPPPGLEPAAGLSRPAPVDPFASRLSPDPLLPSGAPDRVSLEHGDAWENRPAARAGDWDAPAQRQVDHEALIGTPQTWREPPRAPADAGFGFDAPFNRPIMAAAPPARSGLAIPDDWDVPEQAATQPAQTPASPPPATATVPAATPEPILPPLAADLVSAPPLATVPQPAAAPAQTAALPMAAPPAAAPLTAAASPASGAAPPVSTVGGSDGALLFEAFCAGARLSPSAFGGDDRAAVMQRLGEVYRAMVLGLHDLMGERTALRNEYRMTRTMVRAERNNPFKWAPPRRLAVEVLKDGDAGFTEGSAAVTESFRDIKLHLLCMLAGMRAAVGAGIDGLAPEVVERQAKPGGFTRVQRDAALWAAFQEHHARFKAAADDDADGPVNRAFRAAYEAQLNSYAERASGYGDGGSGGERG